MSYFDDSFDNWDISDTFGRFKPDNSFNKSITTISINKRIKAHNIVRDLSNDKLCEMYFENSNDKKVINEIVTSYSFPAYDIAIRCYEDDRMSIKQKNGLQNVLVTYLLKYKKEEKELEF